MKIKKTIKAPGLNIEVVDAVHEFGNININPEKLTVDLRHFENENSEISFDISRLSFDLAGLNQQTVVALDNLKRAILQHEINNLPEYEGAEKI